MSSDQGECHQVTGEQEERAAAESSLNAPSPVICGAAVKEQIRDTSEHNELRYVHRKAIVHLAHMVTRRHETWGSRNIPCVPKIIDELDHKPKTIGVPFNTGQSVMWLTTTKDASRMRRCLVAPFNIQCQRRKGTRLLRENSTSEITANIVSFAMATGTLIVLTSIIVGDAIRVSNLHTASHEAHGRWDVSSSFNPRASDIDICHEVVAHIHLWQERALRARQGIHECAH